MSEHSPLPWRMAEEWLSNSYRLRDANGNTVFSYLPKELATQLRTAMNNHDKLVEALETSLAAMDTVREGSGTNFDGEDEEYIAADMDAIRTAEEKARAALAALKEDAK